MDEFATGFASLSLQDQVLLDFGGDARKGVTVAATASSTSSSLSSTSSSSCCAICLEKIELQEIALVKGCEHAYWFVEISTITGLGCFKQPSLDE
ncbi:hypothetical protein Scep_013888 [Stephania cephalantha]|uniref:RING-type domain-containing protein n=1 Tax=Stephania cephalantha TaxID=152367 RepID=A0AAP0J289_9MAGN